MFEASTQREGGPAEEDGIMWKGRGLTRKLLVETDLFSSEIFNQNYYNKAASNIPNIVFPYEH